MAFDDIIATEKRRAFVLTNEAIVRGAIEAGVNIYAGYPGAPTSEMLDTFNRAQEYFDYRFTIATNEKVALETVAGASMAGFRGLTSMKSVGLNVASDAFYSIGYTGINAGLVMVVADDPHCHSSQSEQDGRAFGPSAYIPMLEPTDPTEAYLMVKDAFAISERFRIPVVLRTTTRVNHQSGIVEFSAVEREPFTKAKWSEIGEPYFTVGEIARKNKLKALERVEALRKVFEASPYNERLNTDEVTATATTATTGSIGIVTAGIGYRYTLDACAAMDIVPPILKIGTLYPLPEDTIAAFLAPLERVVVVEELSPYLENALKRIAHERTIEVEVVGKATGHFSEALEYNIPIVTNALSDVFECDPPRDYDAIKARADELKKMLPTRMPVFCAGCPHRATFWAIKQAIRGQNIVYNNDIGCYSMAFFPPLNFSDSLLSMGSSLGLSAGMAQVVEEKVMAVVGDSTFFHAALPGLVNAVYHQLDITLFVLDNEVTAMTGQQIHAGTPEGRGMPPDKRRIDIEAVCRGIGVEHVAAVDSYDVRENIAVFKAAFDYDGVSVVISRRSCALHGDRIKRRAGDPIIPNEVDKDACKKPHTCIRDFHCPAIIFDADDRASHIQPEVCDGCGVCAKICPFGVIHPITESEGAETEEVE